MILNKEHIEALLFEKIAGTISEQDNLVIEDAMSLDPEVRQAWADISAKMSRPTASQFLENLNQQQAWQNTKNRLNPQSTTSIRIWVKRISVAAAVLLMVLPLSWYFLAHNQKDSIEEDKMPIGQVYIKTDEGTRIEIAGNGAVNIGKTSFTSAAKQLSYSAANAGAIQWATLVVPSAKDYKLKLSDGTQVWLNAASSIRFPSSFSSNKREVYLKGEAYFQVAKDVKHEFIVHTDYADIQVHGTSFNVNAYNVASFATALVEGSVSAKKDQISLTLKAGQEATLERNNQFTVREFDASEVLGWMKGTYFFHNKSIQEIAPVISRLFNVKVNLENAHVAGLTFTGEIDRTLPLSVVVSNLQLSSGIKSELKNGVLTFK